MTARQVSESQVEPFLKKPTVAGIFVDFDGTLSEIVRDPSEATPRAGAAELLDELASSYHKVAVLSGRPVDFLKGFFGGSAVVLSGLYGLEVVDHGMRVDHPLGGAWREVVDDVASVSKARGPAGMRVESKGLSITLHYRGRPRLEPKVRAWAEQWAARSGLVCRPARMSFELHPPIPVDKGTAVLDLADSLEAVCYIGDDLGDLPAFDALEKLSGDGVRTFKVAVRSDEESDEVIRRADATVDGPEGVIALLEKFHAGPGRSGAAKSKKKSAGGS